MGRLSDKLLAILLTLLLGLSPLQGAMAGFVASFVQAEDTQLIADGLDGGMAVSTDRAAVQDCGPCQAGDGCTGQICFSGHCAFCVLAVLPAFSYPTSRTATSGFGLLRADDGVVSQRAYSLFRPPRV